MIEVKVEVHAVHPAGPSALGENKDGRACLPRWPQKSYGSWCTPENTPAHAPITQTNSNIDSRVTQDEARQNESGQDIQLQKVRLFAATPPPDRKEGSETGDVATELRNLKSPQKIPQKPALLPPPAAPIETPQSPVPTSPSRYQKCKGLKLPAYCDPFVPIDPQGRIYISWLFLVTFCYSYNAWCVALRATFPYQTPQNTPMWMVADYFCDVIYLLDVALVKPRLMFLHEGFWVDDPKETRRNYRKKLQYKFDVVSLLPLDLLYVVFGADKVILRFPRVLKLQTFWEFHQAMDRVLSTPYIVRIGKTLFYIFYLIHLNACAYYAMSAYEGLASNGWVYDNVGNAYIRCFYFATKTATSIGKNPKPENGAEYLFMTAAWLMGVFVFALLIGQIRDIITTATMARAEYRKTVDGCSRYLRRLNLPSSIQRRVTSWFNYTWSNQRCFDESKILNSLPFNMKRDVALAVHMSTLSKVQVFQDCSASLLRELVLQLRPETFLPGDAVLRRGDVARHMYIIKSGECLVMSQDESEVVATLHEGSVFGEIALLGIEGLRRRTATVRSRGFSNLFVLSRQQLEAALRAHRSAALVLRRRADLLIRENAARLAHHRQAHSNQSDARSKRQSVSSANTGLERRTRADSSAERRSHADTGLERRTRADNSAERRSHADTGLERRTRADSSAERRSHADTGLERRTRADSSAERRSHADTGLERRTRADSSAERRSHADTGLERRTRADSSAERRSHADTGLERRPHTDSGAEHRPRAASAQSKRRLSAVSEKVQASKKPSSAVLRTKTPLPTIVFSSD